MARKAARVEGLPAAFLGRGALAAFRLASEDAYAGKLSSPSSRASPSLSVQGPVRRALIQP